MKTRVSFVCSMWLCTALVLAGCAEPTRYCIKRSALVPMPSPIQRPATQSTGYVEAGLSNDTLLFAQGPKRLAGRNVGLYVPRNQFAGYLLFSPHPAISIGSSWEAGLGVGSIPISAGTLSSPKQSIGGGGFHVSAHFKLNERVTLDWGCDIWIYRILSHVSYAPCDIDGKLLERPTNDLFASVFPLVRSQLSVGFKLGWSQLTVSLGARNQPYNAEYTEESHYTTATINPAISQAFYAYAHIGWEIHATEWLHFSINAYQPLTFDPIIFYPTVGVNIRITQTIPGFGSRSPPKTRYSGPVYDDF